MPPQLSGSVLVSSGRIKAIRPPPRFTPAVVAGTIINGNDTLRGQFLDELPNLLLSKGPQAAGTSAKAQISAVPSGLVEPDHPPSTEVLG